MSDPRTHLSKTNVCFNWSRLLLSASLPLVFGIFTIMFTMQQSSMSYANRDEDRRQAIELRQQTIYDTYMNDISKLLLSTSFNRSDRQLLNYIGFKTVDVLQHLSSTQKRDVIFFLYNHELNRRTRPENERVILSGADLSNVQFVRSTSMNCHLRDLVLSSILASKIVFDGCDLNYAVFNHAWMVGVKFTGSLMHGCRFYQSNLTDATFHGSNTNKINFSHTTLVNSKFSGIRPYEADFTNADLLHSDLTIRNIFFSKHILLNTRLPNGSFTTIDTSQLVVDGDAEEACVIDRHTNWKLFDKHPGLDLYNGSLFNQTIPMPVNGKCYFHKSVSSRRMYQYISKSHYSLLINDGNAYFNLSAYMGCVMPNRSNDTALIDVRCFDKFYAGPVCAGIKTSKIDSGFQYQTTIASIPRGTVHLRIWLETSISSPSKSNDTIQQACFMDEIKLFIFKKDK